jgi:hypothetical protein
MRFLMASALIFFSSSLFSSEIITDADGSTRTVYRDGEKIGTATLQKQFDDYRAANDAGEFVIAGRLAVRSWVSAKQYQKAASRLKSASLEWDDGAIRFIKRSGLVAALDMYKKAMSKAYQAQTVSAENDDVTWDSKKRGVKIEKEIKGTVAWINALLNSKTFRPDGLNKYLIQKE